MSRTVDGDGELFHFNKIREMVYEKEFTGFSFRKNFSEEGARIADLTKRNVPVNSLQSLEPAYPNGIRRNWFKYIDLMQLLEFISPIYHDDCKAIRHDKSEQDELFPEEIRFSTSAKEQIFVLPFFIISHITGCI